MPSQTTLTLLHKEANKRVFLQGTITFFLNYDQKKEVRTKILGLKVFAYIIKEARGTNSNFKILVCSPLCLLSGTASLKGKTRRYQYVHTN